MNKITLDEVVNKFLDATSKNITDDRLKEALKLQITNDIKEEVINKEIECIIKKSDDKIREKENKEMLDKQTCCVLLYKQQSNRLLKTKRRKNYEKAITIYDNSFDYYCHIAVFGVRQNSEIR